jgi:antirestriction protein ArdC
MAKPKWNAHKHISDLIIEGLERGVGPWSRPWTVLNPGYSLGMSNVLDGSRPFNPCTNGKGRSYNGMNTWLLAITSQIHGWTDPRFCTFKQLAKNKWSIKEGQSKKDGGPGPSDVFFWKVYEKETRTDSGEVKMNRFFTIKVYKVWNLDQLEGPEAWAAPEAPEPIEPVEETEKPDRVYNLAWAVTEEWDSEVSCGHGGDRAYYMPSADRIQMPTYDQFHSEADYLATKFHEQVHSTGHKSREERDFSGRFGNEAYAFEELVAEIGAATLMAATGVASEGEIRDDHVAYIASWIKVLKKDHKAIFTADSQAKKAVNRILDRAEGAGVLPKKEEKPKAKPKAKKKTTKAKTKTKGSRAKKSA